MDTDYDLYASSIIKGTYFNAMLDCGRDHNWWLELVDAAVAARLMVRSLTEARGCNDPEAVSWHVGQHPDPPGDGEPLPGEVIDLTSRRAVA